MSAAQQQVVESLTVALGEVRPDLNEQDRRQQAHYLLGTMAPDDIWAILDELETHGRREDLEGAAG